MKVELKKTDKLQRTLDIEIPQEQVKSKFNEVYEDIKKEVKIPGFRPGTAPRHLLEKHHSKLAQEEVLKRLLPETYQKAIEQENLDVMSLPEISEVNITATSLKYKATVEIRPEIKIKSYKKIKIKRKDEEVKEEDINKFLDQIKKARKIDSIDDKIAKGFGYADLNQFKEAVKRQLIVQKESDNKMQMEEQAVGHLLKNSEFTVPKTLVERRYNELKNEMEKYMQDSRLPEEERKKKLEELDDKLKKQAEEQVKVFLILDEIANLEKIQRDNEMPKRVMEFLFQNAEWS